MNDIQKKYEREITELTEACIRCAQLGYVTSSGGNLSCRMSDGNILITPTKTPKRQMRFEDICVTDKDGNRIFFPEGKKPTGEVLFHLRIMKKRPDINAIVHAHPPIITGFAIAHSDILAKPILPEPVIEVGPMLNVKYEAPLSRELSEAFDAVIEKSNGFVMENHGALVCSENGVTDAVDRLEMYEAMAKSALTAVLLGKVERLSAADLKNLDGVIKERNLKIPGTGMTTLEEVYG